MSSKYAGRQFSKVIRRCPYCGSRRPKELVGAKGFDVVGYVLCGVFTCGLGFLMPFFFFKEYLETYCDGCGRTYNY